MLRSLAISVASALALWASFPPVRWTPLVLLAPAGFMYAAATAPDRRSAGLAGASFGAVLIGALMEWIANLGEEAIAGLVIAQAPFYAALAVLIWGFREHPAWELGTVSAGGWVAMEFLRERIPVGGLNWGAIGYPLGDWAATRHAASWIGTSGLGVMVAVLASGLVLVALRRDGRWLAGAGAAGVALTIAGAVTTGAFDGGAVRVAVIQGNSPCPLEHCAGERQLIFDNHLELTRGLQPGTVDLVVWPESSTTFSVGEPSAMQLQVAEEARRLGATFLVGGDRSGSEDTFINSNVVFGPAGELLGEYRKNHPVPFGEYVPLRAVFGLIPETARVPRDMVRGDGPTVFAAPFGKLGSVISFEGAFSRYSREAVAAGSQVLVVASNEASYGVSAASDQFIAMTRMRSAENGVDIVHAAVTGSSTIITDGGRVGEQTALFEEAVVLDEVVLRAGGPTLFTRWGDWLAVAAIAALATALMWRWTQQASAGAARRTLAFTENLVGLGE